MDEQVPSEGRRVGGVLSTTAVLSVCVALVLGLLLYHLAKERAAPSAVLRVYCGSSMEPAIKDLKAEFEHRYDSKAELNLGGSEVLLPAIRTSRQGDLFICHDPFPALLQSDGLLAASAAVGWLRPVLLTAPGNPLGLHSLADLARPGVRVGLTDARHTTCGELVEKELTRQKLLDAVRKNVAVESRTHADLAAKLSIGHLDALVVWNFTAQLYRDKADAVTLNDPFPETRVVVCLLTCAQAPAEARKFLDLAGSDEGRAIFARHGYTPGPDDGKEGK